MTPTFIQIFDTLVGSGLLARLSGSAVKVLLTLGLAATPLGSGSGPAGSPRADAFFAGLVAAGTVSPDDRRRLFCGLSHHELIRRTGLGKNTVTRCTGRHPDWPNPASQPSAPTIPALSLALPAPPRSTSRPLPPFIRCANP